MPQTRKIHRIGKLAFLRPFKIEYPLTLFSLGRMAKRVGEIRTKISKDKGGKLRFKHGALKRVIRTEQDFIEQ